MIEREYDFVGVMDESLVVAFVLFLPAPIADAILLVGEDDR
jgi:hypothetical protein